MPGAPRILIAGVIALSVAAVALTFALSGGGTPATEISTGLPLASTGIEPPPGVVQNEPGDSAPPATETSTGLPLATTGVDPQLEPGDTPAPTNGEPGVALPLDGGSTTGGGLSEDERDIQDRAGA